MVIDNGAFKDSDGFVYAREEVMKKALPCEMALWSSPFYWLCPSGLRL